jgi:hypothetical protein
VKRYFFVAVSLLFAAIICVPDFLHAEDKSGLIYSIDEKKTTASEEFKVINEEDSRTASANEDENDFTYVGDERKSKKQFDSEIARAASVKGGQNVSATQVIVTEPEVKTNSAETVKKAAKPSAASKTGASAHEPMFAKAIRENYNTLKANPKVKKIISFVSDGWKEVKAFVVELPGISHYLNSKYSNENYKKEMGGMSKEYSPHLKSNSAGVQKVKQGAKKF